MGSDWHLEISTHAPAGGATDADQENAPTGHQFLLTPLREGRRCPTWEEMCMIKISTHAPAGGATNAAVNNTAAANKFLLTPLREGRPLQRRIQEPRHSISTHAPAGGATQGLHLRQHHRRNFYSRPCGRGDLLFRFFEDGCLDISTHAPAGGATKVAALFNQGKTTFLLTPLREGRPSSPSRPRPIRNFYSRPCGRGDPGVDKETENRNAFLLTPLREGRRVPRPRSRRGRLFLLTPLREGRQASVVVQISSIISTHAPAGGATAIFHKSVMRFCGKLPKDDTVLCLASFGFPGRDPKAVYLAWISCANLPQKCVREGLALKDQGTSCFHEGLASHAFDPVLV